MATDRCALTVYFEDPFWVGLFERWEGESYRVSKLTFGPEPRDAEVWERVLREFDRLPFSREARRQMEAIPRTGTKAQRALALQRQEGKLARREESRAEREAAEALRFRQRQEKRREKRRGH